MNASALSLEKPSGHIGSIACQRYVNRTKLDQNSRATTLDGNFARRAAASERVKHGVAGLASGQNARLDQILWKGGKMRLGVRLSGDGPDRALVAEFIRLATWPNTRNRFCRKSFVSISRSYLSVIVGISRLLFDRLRVVKIAIGLGEQVNQCLTFFVCDRPQKMPKMPKMRAHKSTNSSNSANSAGGHTRNLTRAGTLQCNQ